MNLNNVVLGTAVLLAASLASCQKDKGVTPAATTHPEASIMTAKSGGFKSVKLNEETRQVDADYECCAGPGTCAPEDIVIKGYQHYQLYHASQIGGSAVKALFSNEATALTYVPDWNAPYFADVKAAILSGKYTFVTPNNGTFFLGEEGKVSLENYDYVLSFKF